MNSKQLPTPVSGSDFYLLAIVEELRALRALLDPILESAPPIDESQLRERLEAIKGIGPAKAEQILNVLRE